MVIMGILSYQGKNPLGRAGNRIRDLMISSQKRWPLDHEAGSCETYGEKGVLGEVFLPVRPLPPVAIIQPILHIIFLSSNGRDMIIVLAVDSNLRWDTSVFGVFHIPCFN
jgi:hypothetical protein